MSVSDLDNRKIRALLSDADVKNICALQAAQKPE